MTVDCSNIESLLGPLRNAVTYENRSFPSLWGGGSLDGLAWTSTSDRPVSDWIGYIDEFISHDESIVHDEVRERMRVAAFVAFMKRIPALNDGYKWSLLDHQAGGVSCRHVRFVGMRIALNPEIEAKLLEIAKSWYNSQLGWIVPSLTELNKYQSQIQKLGLDCNNSDTFTRLTESFYPVDLDQSVVDRVCQNPVPLKSLMAKPQPYGCISDPPILVVIAPNSD